MKIDDLKLTEGTVTPEKFRDFREQPQETIVVGDFRLDKHERNSSSESSEVVCTASQHKYSCL